LRALVWRRSGRNREEAVDSSSVEAADIESVTVAAQPSCSYVEPEVVTQQLLTGELVEVFQGIESIYGQSAKKLHHQNFFDQAKPVFGLKNGTILPSSNNLKLILKLRT
jgi:hypothetical protein